MQSSWVYTFRGTCNPLPLIRVLIDQRRVIPWKITSADALNYNVQIMIENKSELETRPAIVIKRDKHYINNRSAYIRMYGTLCLLLAGCKFIARQRCLLPFRDLSLAFGVPPCAMDPICHIHSLQCGQCHQKLWQLIHGLWYCCCCHLYKRVESGRQYLHHIKGRRQTCNIPINNLIPGNIIICVLLPHCLHNHHCSNLLLVNATFGKQPQAQQIGEGGRQAQGTVVRLDLAEA